VDLYMWSCNEALAFGRRTVDVTVLRLGWDPHATTPSLLNRSGTVATEPRLPARPLPQIVPDGR
jgi:hypothetical protein